MTFDPTTNRIPFGLLTSEEQDALKAWPHGWERYQPYGKTWESCSPFWNKDAIYRGNPEPKVTSYWFHVYEGPRVGNMWSSQKVASSNSHGDSILMRMDICNGEVTVTKETN